MNVIWIRVWAAYLERIEIRLGSQINTGYWRAVCPVDFIPDIHCKYVIIPVTSMCNFVMGPGITWLPVAPCTAALLF